MYSSGGMFPVQDKTLMIKLFMVTCNVGHDINLSNSDINIKKTIGFVFHIKYGEIKDKKCNFFYENLLMKKFQKPPYQTILSQEFAVYDIHIWTDIYKSNILDIMDISVAEFNYKLLNNLLNNKHSESIASNTKSPTGGIFHQNSSTKI
jgi:hypothetical protein